MKKIIKIMLFMILMMPWMVKASEVQIKTSVELSGKQLEKEEFSFVLKNQAGEIIQRKKNDESGLVTFDPVEVRTDEAESIYFIEEENLKKPGYTYDDNKVFVKVVNSSSTVTYYKDKSLEQQMKEEIPVYEPKEAYHATAEELQGDAYAVLDLETETLYFRRYENLDTSNFDYSFDDSRSWDPNMALDLDNGYMYLRNIENDKSRFKSSLNYCYWVNNSQRCPKKVVFEDAFKPTFSDGQELFNYCRYTEEFDFSHFDTSNITNMNGMFRSSTIKKLDLSTFETSQVTTMEEMFKYSYNLEEIDITSFSGSSLLNARSMFESCYNLNVLKVSSKFKTTKLTNAYGMFMGTSKLLLLDLSWLYINENTDASSIFHTSGLKYLNLSHWTFQNGTRKIGTYYNSVFATSFSGMPNLIYFDMSNVTTPIEGAYGSSDIVLSNDVKVIKISKKYNPHNPMTSLSDLTFYNVDNNIITNDISTTNENNYRLGGTYLNIQDESGGFRNSYKEVDKTESIINILENPQTGNIIFFIILLGFSTMGVISISLWLRKIQ